MLGRISQRYRVDTLVYRRDGQIDNSWLATGSAESWIPASESAIEWLFGSDRSRRRRFLHFLRSGGLGVFLVRNGQWVSYGWSTQPGNKVHPPHLACQVCCVNAYWIFYCHIRDVFRGQGIFKHLITRLVSLIHARNPDAEILFDAHPDNVPSHRTAVRCGFMPSGVMVTYKLWIPPMGSLVLGGKWLHQRPHFPQYTLLESAINLTCRTHVPYPSSGAPLVSSFDVGHRMTECATNASGRNDFRLDATTRGPSQNRA